MASHVRRSITFGADAPYHLSPRIHTGVRTDSGEERFLDDVDPPIRRVGEGVDDSIGPQAESWVVVDEQIQVIREPMVKIAAGRGGSTREVEVGLDDVDDHQDPILQRIEGVEVEGPIHLQLFGVMRRQPLDQEVEPTATARRANPFTHEGPAFNEAPVPKQSDDLAIGRVLQQTSGCPLLV